VTRALVACMLVATLGACGRSSKVEGVTVYPLPPELTSLPHPRDAVRRFEEDYRVKPGTGRYNIFAYEALHHDCFQVEAQKGTEFGIHVIHASREDGDVIYCYDAQTGQFTGRL
jgi:hypothetical protein